ncbi:zf-HC2 domain-containing protein [Gordonia aichiensis]|uniref:Putative zinc-finger domain-containing protein n=1 Tax=Gordonia aichiensis NBRC 108223 TaxID=1220583 RepID=L7KED2_9ACTN|nr:zf-HC2 domain-containing protein [Gordonia aichiensis]GAC47245.1 hypothetical protein GOACH_03_02630 [Gordonia aichiensis NBRC 108223]
MRCEVARESLSARIDGERESVPAARVDEHLAHCPGCERWYATARGMNFSAADLAPDLSTTILEASRSSQGPDTGPHRFGPRGHDNGVSRVATALRAGSVACAVAVVVLCFGYLTGSAPLWYPVIQGVLALCAVGLVVAATVVSRRSRTDRHNVGGAQSPAPTTVSDDAAGAVTTGDGGVDETSSPLVFDLAALRARRHSGPAPGDTRH